MMKTFNKIISLIIMIAIISSLSVNVAFASGEANAASQTFYPKDISGITFTGASNTTGYVKSDDNGNITTSATKTIQSGFTYYKDDEGNYAFSAKHDGATKGCINIPVNVTTAGKYDVTVNYYISPVDTYTSTSAWLVKANDQILAYTNAHGTNGASNIDKMVLEAGSADFTQGVNTISFELSSLEKYARRIIIESIVLTPKKDRTFFVNPDSLTINSNSSVVAKSIAYNGSDQAPWVVTKFETTSAPTAGETYIEFTLNAPFDGNYTIAFDKVGALSGTKTGGKWNVSVNNGTATLVDFTRDFRSKDTVSINSALKEGINTLKFVYDSTESNTGEAKQDYGFFLTGINLNYIPKDKIEVANAPVLFGEASTQTFYPKNISGITFEGRSPTGYATKLDAGGHSTSSASTSVDQNTYVDEDGNYTFLAKQNADGTGGTINIPIDVSSKGYYDVTVNYHITDNAATAHSSLYNWVVKANDTFLSYTDFHGTGALSLTKSVSLNAGCAEFNGQNDKISFTLFEPSKYARSIVIESIVLTPNTNMNFSLNHSYVTMNSTSVMRTVSPFSVNTTRYMRADYAPSEVPTVGKTSIDFSFNAPCEGDYDITFNYTGLLGNTYTGGKWNVALNGEEPKEVSFAHNYRSSKSTTINAHVKKGQNTMTFTYAGTTSSTEQPAYYGFFLTDSIVFTLTSDAPQIEGVEIEDMPEAGTYQARATIKNDTSNDETAVIIAAVYGMENNKVDLKNIDYKEYSVEVGKTKEISTPVIVPEGITDGWITLFVWTDIDNKITPIIKSTTIK